MDTSFRDHADRHVGDHHEAFDASARRGNVTRLSAPSVVATPSGAGWYHEAAIEAARRDAVEARCNPYAR